MYADTKYKVCTDACQLKYSKYESKELNACKMKCSKKKREEFQ